jgi:hypothetical protein
VVRRCEPAPRSARSSGSPASRSASTRAFSSARRTNIAERHGHLVDGDASKAWATATPRSPRRRQHHLERRRAPAEPSPLRRRWRQSRAGQPRRSADRRLCSPSGESPAAGDQATGRSRLVVVCARRIVAQTDARLADLRSVARRRSTARAGAYPRHRPSPGCGTRTTAATRHAVRAGA